MQSAKYKVQNVEWAMWLQSKHTALRLAAVLTAMLALAPHIFAQSQQSAANPKSEVQNPRSEPPIISRTISLSDAVEIALANNPRALVQRAESNAARARVGMARAVTRPQLSTTTFTTTGTMPNIIAGPPGVEPGALAGVPDKGRLDQNLMAMFPLYTGGRLSGQVRSAEALAAAVDAGVRSTELDVAFDAKTAYRRVLLGQRIVDAYRARVDESRERVRIAEEAFKEGRIAKFDLLRNQTELAESEQTLVNAQRDVDVALVDLKNALGISQASDLTLSDALGFEPVQETLEAIETRALEQRPEVSAARARIESAQADLSVARSAYRPQVYAVGMQDFAAMSGNGFEQGFTVGVAVALPIFDGGRRKSSVNEAQAVIERMRAEERDVVLAVSRDVNAAWAELQAAAKNVALSQTAVQQAEEDYRVIKLRYDAGKAINVEVLDALSSLTRAQTNYAQALFDYNTARDRLKRAAGET